MKNTLFSLILEREKLKGICCQEEEFFAEAPPEPSKWPLNSGNYTESNSNERN
jgi:hypothetical protein